MEHHLFSGLRLGFLGYDSRRTLSPNVFFTTKHKNFKRIITRRAKFFPIGPPGGGAHQTPVYVCAQAIVLPPCAWRRTTQWGVVSSGATNAPTLSSNVNETSRSTAKEFVHLPAARRFASRRQQQGRLPARNDSPKGALKRWVRAHLSRACAMTSVPSPAKGESQGAAVAAKTRVKRSTN